LTSKTFSLLTLRADPASVLVVKTAVSPQMLTLEMDRSHASPARELDDFDAVVRQYWPRIFRLFFASTRDRDAAESIAQDCLWRAYQARSRFRGDASLNTWLIQIAINLIRDFKRCRRIQFWKRVQVAIPKHVFGSPFLPCKGCHRKQQRGPRTNGCRLAGFLKTFRSAADSVSPPLRGRTWICWKFALPRVIGKRGKSASVSSGSQDSRACRSNTMKHLTSEQISSSVAGWNRDENEQQHAAACPVCAAEIERVRELLTQFRASISRIGVTAARQ
jgi:hypothetical protein